MGGYAGHIKHIYEANTTTSCIINLFDNIVWGDKFFTEKLDGLAISAALTDNGIRFARNKTQVAQGGISAQDLISFFNNHPAKRTFLEGCSTIYSIFSDTNHNFKINKFYNFEIVDKNRCNIINYDHSFVTLHHDFNSFETVKLSKDIITASPEFDFLDNLRTIQRTNDLFPELSQRWNYFHNEVQCFGGFADKSDTILYDCLKYDLLSSLKGGHLYENVISRILDMSKCSYHHAVLATQYVYNINSINARDLLKLDPSLKIISSREKSRVFLRDTFKIFHEQVQNISKFIFKLMPNNSIVNNTSYEKINVSTDTGLLTEGIVFCWLDGLYKLTGDYQELNQTQGKYKDD